MNKLFNTKNVDLKIAGCAALIGIVVNILCSFLANVLNINLGNNFLQDILNMLKSHNDKILPSSLLVALVVFLSVLFTQLVC